MPWWRRKLPPLAGSGLYRGTPGPRAENFEHLRRDGVELRRLPDRPEQHWALEVAHPAWGRARLISFREQILPNAVLIESDHRLSADEQKAAKAAGSTIHVSYEAGADHVLKERKRFLRFLHAASNESTVALADNSAHAFWSPAELEEELSHDADVDILSLFTLHHVTADSGTEWMHSHGLGQLGLTEIDLINPAREIRRGAFDLIRALAFAVAEGEVTPNGGAFQLASPGGLIRLVPNDQVLRRGAGLPPDWRGLVDDEHTAGHAVVCDPKPPRSFLFGGQPRPSRFISSSIDDNLLIQFSSASSRLMAERARATYSVLRRLLEDLRGLPLQPVVKIGYVIDNGGPGDLEHLWFEVHAAGDVDLDATLVNEPMHIARFKSGERGRHDLDKMSDWMILTPFGSITPRGMKLARELAMRKDELLKAMAGKGLPNDP